VFGLRRVVESNFEEQGTEVRLDVAERDSLEGWQATTLRARRQAPSAAAGAVNFGRHGVELAQGTAAAFR